MRKFLPVLFFVFPLAALTAEANLCNGTDTINCKISTPRHSPTRFKVETLLFSYDSSYGFMESEKANEPLLKDRAIEKLVVDAYKDFEKLEKNKLDYDKVECALDQYKETKRIHVKKDEQVGHIPGFTPTKEPFENVLFYVKIKCTVNHFVPINMAEVKAHQCLEAQRCLSEVTTMTELKRMELFRNTMCGSSDNVHVTGDSGRKGKAQNLPSISQEEHSKNSSR